MSPDLLFHPSFDHGETPTRIADPKVVHPAAQDRIDYLNHLPHGLADLTAEDLPELAEQRFPLLLLGLYVRSPLPGVTQNAAKSATQEAKALSLLQIHHPALSSLISTRSFANSSRSRLSTALTSQSCRG